MKGGVVVISFLVVEFFFANHLVCQEIQKSQYLLKTFLSITRFTPVGRLTPRHQRLPNPSTRRRDNADHPFVEPPFGRTRLDKPRRTEPSGPPAALECPIVNP
jgi:hypothetical protein